jgi:hypothetical protein
MCDTPFRICEPFNGQRESTRLQLQVMGTAHTCHGGYYIVKMCAVADEEGAGRRVGQCVRMLSVYAKTVTWPIKALEKCDTPHTTVTLETTVVFYLRANWYLRHDTFSLPNRD